MDGDQVLYLNFANNTWEGRGIPRAAINSGKPTGNYTSIPDNNIKNNIINDYQNLADQF